MKTQTVRTALSVLLAITLANRVATAQVATGTPPFNSYGGGPFDTVNLGNLNVHFTIPIVHKAGRGLPFALDLTYDSSIWKTATVNKSLAWTHAPTWGWKQVPTFGTITYSIESYDCTYSDPYTLETHTAYTQYTYDNWAFVDQAGVSHPLPGYTQSWNGGTHYPECQYPSDIPSATGSATDGSGYTLSIVNHTDATVVSPSGWKVFSSNSSGYTFTDANGNKLTRDNAGNYFDTLSGTVPVLTMSGNTFTYYAPGGGSVPVLVSTTTNYQSYTVQTNFGVASVAEFGPLQFQLVDNIQLPDGTKYTFTYERTPGNCTLIPGTVACVTGRIGSVTLPTGGQITYSYTGGTNNGGIYSDGSTAGLTRALTPATACAPSAPTGCWQYTRALQSGTPGPNSLWQTSISDPVGNNTVINFAEDRNTTSPTYSFYETQRQVNQLNNGNQSLLLTITTCYLTYSCDSSGVSSPITAMNVTTKYPSGWKSTRTTGYNANGSITFSGQTAWTTGTPSGAIQTTQIDYATINNVLTTHPRQVASYDGSSNLLSKTAYFYDESAYPVQTPPGITPQHDGTVIPSGNVTTITTYSSVSGTLSKHFQYNNNGTLYKSYDVNGSSSSYTSYSYDTTLQNNGQYSNSCGNSFATTVTSPPTPGAPSGLLTSTGWNCYGAVATSTTDANQNTKSVTYSDPFYWRPTSAKDELQTQTTFQYNLPGSGTGGSVDSQMLFNSGNSVVETLSTIDVFGRPVLSQKHQGPNSGLWDTTQTTYDSLGVPFQASLPCAAAAGSGCSTAVTTLSYDALGRPTHTQDGGGGTVDMMYTDSDMQQTQGPKPSGENVKRKVLEYDALGRLTSVCEVTAGTTSAPAGDCGQRIDRTGYLTKYDYGFDTSSGRIRMTVTQNAQPSGTPQARVYLYDLLGRLVSETNPESGTKLYFFDAALATPGVACPGAYNGDLVKRYDANGNTTCFTYDSLHRLTSKTYSGPNAANTPSKAFAYDTTTSICPGGLSNVAGRLAEAYTGPSSAKTTDLAYCYTARGETSEVFELTPNSGGYYQVPMTYWENGLLKSYTFLGSSPLGYNPDGEGRPYKIPGAWYLELQSTDYNAASQPTRLMTSCNGSTCYPITYTYDPNTLRMTRYQGDFNNGTVYGQLTWNPNGSLKNLLISDPINPADAQTCNYSADDLSRIASVNCVNGSTTVWSQAFSYDAFGNITKSGSISWMPGYDSNTNHYTLGGTSYDANGNVLNDTFNSYTWDAEGKPVSNSNGNQTWSYVTDAFGHRVELLINGAYSRSYLAIGKIKLSAQGQTAGYSEFPLPGGNKFSQNGGATGLQMADWLGTIRLFYSYTGGNVGLGPAAHAPFGEYYGVNSSYPPGFAGMGGLGWGQGGDGVRNNTTYWADERDYRSSQGRWLTPDPIGLGAVDPADPRTWNRYAYVRNDPLALIDPLGEADYASCSWDPWNCQNGGSWLIACTTVAGSTECEEDFATGGGGGPEPGGIGSGGGGGVSFTNNGAISRVSCNTISPNAPPGVSVAKNVQLGLSVSQQNAEAEIAAERMGSDNMGEAFIASNQWVYNQFKTNGPQDYKNIYGHQYDNFGNFNYGAVCGAVFGSLTHCQSAAGIGLIGRTAWLGFLAGLSNSPTPPPRYNGQGIPYVKAPYGDQPTDSAWIAQGYAYQSQGCD